MPMDRTDAGGGQRQEMSRENKKGMYPQEACTRLMQGYRQLVMPVADTF